jgi:ABC-type multidrug transport system fused ATPase/permease subunit
MNKGKIVEVGNHKNLLSDYPEGIYSKFVKEQEGAEDPTNSDSNSDS